MIGWFIIGILIAVYFAGWIMATAFLKRENETNTFAVSVGMTWPLFLTLAPFYIVHKASDKLNKTLR